MRTPIEYALTELYGLKEIRGQEDNPLIVKMFHEIGHSEVNDDETAWCAAAHSWIHKMLGYSYTGKLNARSWLDSGRKLHQPEFGCTVVLWRVSPDSWQGHVGFFIREDGDYIWMLGGNQNNEYNISKYPKNQVLSYREIPKHYSS